LIVFLFAALTSAFSMLEMIVSVISKGNVTKRKKWVWIIGLAIFAFGVPSALSFGLLSDVTLFDKTIFDLADYTVSNILMPIGSLLMALFVSYQMKKEDVHKEVRSGSEQKDWVFTRWYVLLRYVVAILSIFVMLDVLGVW